MEQFYVNDQVAIVTGAGQGIGKATALTLSDLGAKIAVNDRHLDRIQNVIKEIKKKGGSAISCPGDVSLLSIVKKVVEETIKKYGRIDILINNAAVGSTRKVISEISYDDWDNIIKNDLTSVFMFCKEVLPYMIKQKRGKIVNISSGAGITGLATATAYSSAKAGVIGLTKALAREVAKYKINVNALGTGLTDTAMSRVRGLEAQMSSILWPRVGQPQDMANAIAFLVSDSAEYITGQVICPNGGAWMA